MNLAHTHSPKQKTGKWLLGAALLPLIFSLQSCKKEKFETTEQPWQNSSNVVTIDNTKPRRDVDGKIIDAHDGCIQLFGSTFYLYGTAYGTNDGYSHSNQYCVYSSPDLKQWRLIGNLLENTPPGVYYRPDVIHDANTGKYVLWYNWYPQNLAGQTGVAISDKPIGPFSIINSKIQLACSHPGDGSLFVDDDGTGYYIYDAIDDGYTVRISRLTRDYLNVTGESSDVVATGAEAPLLFRKKNTYYAIVGELCVFCCEGAEAHVLASSSPMGPFDPLCNINRRPNSGIDQFIQPTTKRFGLQTKAPLISGQQTWIAKIPMKSEIAFIWMADLWGSAPDGVKGHDLQYWSPPLKFNPANNSIAPIENVLQWDLNWSTTSKSKPSILATGRHNAAPEFIRLPPVEANNLAWVLATHPDAQKRDGPRAVKLAESACQQTRFKITILVGTLAASYAEVGRFEDAIATAEKACQLAQEGGEKELFERNKKLLEIYRNRKPFREKIPAGN
jgi:hypothetical protein